MAREKQENRDSLERMASQPHTRRAFVAASALAAGALVGAAGCASGGSSEATGSSTASGESEQSASSESAEPLTLNAALDYPAAYSEANPVGNTRALWVSAGWHVFEALYEIDFAAYSVHNVLAAGDPVQLSDTEYEVQLREGAKFSNGEDVTAADVVNAFQMNLVDETYGVMLSFIDSVVVVDESKVLFTLKYPIGDLLQRRLSLVKVFPASVAEEGLQQLPIGSGPWQYEEFPEDEIAGEVSFTPNPFYNGSAPANFDRMVWHATTDGDERFELLRNKAVTVCENVPFSQLGAAKDVGATTEYIQGFGQPFLMFNCQKPPFNDRRVRQAFFYAIDAEKLIADEMEGHASLVTGFLPQTFPNYHEASTIYTYDPEKAAFLLENAGVKNLSFVLTTNDNWVKSLAEGIRSNLADVGITMENKETQIDWRELAPSETDEILPFDVILTPGDPTCFGVDPDLLMSWWYGDNVWTRGRSCWSKAGDGKFEDLQALLQSARTALADERQELWNACFDLISEEVPLYALFHREVATGFYDSMLNGFESIGTTGLMLLGTTPK